MDILKTFAKIRKMKIIQICSKTCLMLLEPNTCQQIAPLRSCYTSRNLGSIEWKSFLSDSFPTCEGHPTTEDADQTFLPDKKERS